MKKDTSDLLDMAAAKERTGEMQMGVMQTCPDIADEFLLYVRESSATGSKKPSSYVQAIHILNAVLNDKCPDILSRCHNLWLLTDAVRLECIRKYVLAECKKQDGGSSVVSSRKVTGRTTTALRPWPCLFRFSR